MSVVEGLDVKATSELRKALAKATTEAVTKGVRREIAGALLRYIKDGASDDLGQFVFHYLLIEDYGQAMVEGWGELFTLLQERLATEYELSIRDPDILDEEIPF